MFEDDGWAVLGGILLILGTLVSVGCIFRLAVMFFSDFGFTVFLTVFSLVVAAVGGLLFKANYDANN